LAKLTHFCSPKPAHTKNTIRPRSAAGKKEEAPLTPAPRNPFIFPQRVVFAGGSSGKGHPAAKTPVRPDSAKRIEDYYEALRIADKLAPQSASELLAIDLRTTYSSVAMYTTDGVGMSSKTASMIP
jgi:hypothetical protein